MLCISTKERKHVSQSKRRGPPIKINHKFTVTVLKAKVSGLHRERTSTRCTDFQHAYGVLVVVIVVVIVIVIVIVQIYRT